MEVETQNGAGAEPAAAGTTRDQLAGIFAEELAAERGEAEADEAPEGETQEIAEEADEAEPGTESSEERTASDEEPDGEPEEAPGAPAIKAPSGMSAADKAVFDKLPTEAKAWISKREAERHADYQRKTSETADIRKGVEGRLTQLTQAMEIYDQFLAPFAEQPLTPPDPALRQSDPFRYDEDLANYTTAKHQQEVAIQKRAENARHHQQLQEERRKTWVNEQRETLKSVAPDLADQTEKGARLRKSVFEYGKKLGHSPDLLNMASAIEMATLMKAMRYDALDAAKKNAKPTVTAAPKIAKPGPSKGAGGRPTNLARAVSQLDQTPTRDNLAAAFLAEIQSERRN